jgi:hypothetical protein
MNTNLPTEDEIAQLTDEDRDAAETHGLTEREAQVTKDVYNVVYSAMNEHVPITYVIGMLRAMSNELAREANTVADERGVDLKRWRTLPLEQDDILRDGVLDANDYARVTVVDDEAFEAATRQEIEDATQSSHPLREWDGDAE